MVALFFLALASSSEARVFPSQSDIVIYVLKVSTSPLVTGMQTLYADENEWGWKEKSEGILWFTKICLNIHHF